MLTLSAKYYQRKYRLRKLYFGSTAGFGMISVIGKGKTLGDTGPQLNIRKAGLEADVSGGVVQQRLKFPRHLEELVSI